MNLLSFHDPIQILPLKSPSPLHSIRIRPQNSNNHAFKHTHGGFTIKTSFFPFLSKPLMRTIVKACSADNIASAAEIDMVRNKDGVFAPKAKKVVVLWDLDNKPPRGAPYEAANALRHVAQRFGEVVEISAYANRHAFIHLPHWVLEERRKRRQLDILERHGAVVPPPETYVCSICGRKCKTNLHLKKHFRQLHLRERQKKLNRMKSLKGKKRQRFKERYIDGNSKYNEAARTLITPKVGYGLASELRRAGVYVKTVEDKPQAADWALKRQMQHSMSRGIDWLFLVSDDSDFSEMLRRAREANLGTVVVGDWDGALGRHADLWVPWLGVQNGEILEDDLKQRRREVVERDGGPLSVSVFGEEASVKKSLDGLVDELVAARSDFHFLERSLYSEGEDDESDGDFLWDSEEEDREENGGYL